MASTLREKAETLRRLHQAPPILVLPNAWDVASARVFEQLGVRAIGTTSAGIAFALGFADGERISRDEMMQAVARIAGRVRVPVTADIEAGYGPKPADVAETVRQTIQAGAVGINLEDVGEIGDATLVEMPLQIERIKAAREAGEAAGVPLVINARTDVYLLEVGDPQGRLEHAVQRANAYREAGADCLFVPGVSDATLIAKLTREIDGPVNILLSPAGPTIAELSRLGVARLSVGSAAARASWGLARKIGVELLGPGTYRLIEENAIPYPELNDLMKGSHS